MRRWQGMVAAALVGIVAVGLVPAQPAEARRAYDMYFPLAGDGYYYYKSFGNCRDYCRRRHMGVDIMAPKLTPVVAVADGTVRYLGEGEECCAVSIIHADGYHSVYAHLNNDTPGTDDGKLRGYAPGIALGIRVSAGTLLGWVGDSGNSENTGSHLHFELRRPRGAKGEPIDPWPSLRAATLLDRPLRRVTTICDFNGDGAWDRTVGDPGADVGEVMDAGAVRIEYGSSPGPVALATGPARQQVLMGAGERDLFGAASACGDFNGDGFVDLAVGAPGADLERARHAGQVVVYLGSADGLTESGRLVLTPDIPRDDRFGSALGAADRDGDGFVDLAVGAPYTATRWSKNGGVVIFYRGTPSGPRNPAPVVSPEPRGLPHLIRFGTSIHVEDRTGDGLPDFIVGSAGTETGDPGGGTFFVFPALTSPQLTGSLD